MNPLLFRRGCLCVRNMSSYLSKAGFDISVRIGTGGKFFLERFYKCLST